MKRAQLPALILVTLLAVFAIVAMLYTVSYGRRVRHQGVRVVRLVRNATGIYPLPSLKWKTRGEGRGPLLVEVYESGRIVVSGRGDTIEQQLTRDTAHEILEAGKAAIEEFSTGGCGTKYGGITSELDLLLDGRWVGRACPATAELPNGPAISRLLKELATSVPEVSNRF